MAPKPTFTILVVDESPAVRLFVDLAVGSDAVRVLWTPDGFEALRTVEQVQPNLVMAATQLAGISGRQMADRLSRWNVPVVLLSGWLKDTDTELGAALGIMSRPLQVQPLRSLVARLAAQQPVQPEAPAEDLGTERSSDFDEIEAWMTALDGSLGLGPGPHNHVIVQAAASSGFERDIAALRAGDTRQRLLVNPQAF